jgi:hypothetical protein
VAPPAVVPASDMDDGHGTVGCPYSCPPAGREAVLYHSQFGFVHFSSVTS